MLESALKPGSVIGHGSEVGMVADTGKADGETAEAPWAPDHIRKFYKEGECPECRPLHLRRKAGRPQCGQYED